MFLHRAQLLLKLFATNLFCLRVLLALSLHQRLQRSQIDARLRQFVTQSLALRGFIISQLPQFCVHLFLLVEPLRREHQFRVDIFLSTVHQKEGYHASYHYTYY